MNVFPDMYIIFPHGLYIIVLYINSASFQSSFRSGNMSASFRDDHDGLSYAPRGGSLTPGTSGVGSVASNISRFATV